MIISIGRFLCIEAEAKTFARSIQERSVMRLCPPGDGGLDPRRLSMSRASKQDKIHSYHIVIHSLVRESIYGRTTDRKDYPAVLL
jgi:hypothetical protein